MQVKLVNILTYVPILSYNKNLAIANKSRVSCAHNTLGALKMQDKTLQDRTMTDKLAWPDFAGQDNDGQEKHHAWVEIKT